MQSFSNLEMVNVVGKLNSYNDILFIFSGCYGKTEPVNTNHTYLTNYPMKARLINGMVTPPSIAPCDIPSIPGHKKGQIISAFCLMFSFKLTLPEKITTMIFDGL